MVNLRDMSWEEMIDTFKHFGKGLSILATGNLGVKKGYGCIGDGIPKGKGILIEITDYDTFYRFTEYFNGKMSLMQSVVARIAYEQGITYVFGFSKRFGFVGTHDKHAIFGSTVDNISACTYDKEGNPTEIFADEDTYRYWKENNEVWKKADKNLSFED